MTRAHTLYNAFRDADDAWSCELHRCFGKRAGDVRYTPQGKGEPGTMLRETHDAFCRTGDAWRSSLGLVTVPADHT